VNKRWLGMGGPTTALRHLAATGRRLLMAAPLEAHFPTPANTPATRAVT